MELRKFFCYTFHTMLSPLSFYRIGVFRLILLTLVTNGLAIPWWFFKQRAAFNALDAQEKIGKGMPTAIFVLYCIATIFLIAIFFIEDPKAIKALNDFNSVITLVGGILGLFIILRMRRMLTEHSSKHSPPIVFSYWRTIVFFIYYLQYKFNKL